MGQKLLTVSIAAYNVEKYIEECLESFSDDRFADSLEVIVVNDGSKDNTLSIAQKYAEKYSSIIKVIDKENGGWGSTINAATKVATGKYFKHLDGDDYFNKEALIQFLDYIKNEESDLVFTDYKTFDDISGDEIAKLIVLDGVESPIIGQKDILGLKEYHFGMHSMCIKTELIREIGLEEHCFYVDDEFVLKMISQSNSYSYYPSLYVYMYRLGREGQSVSIAGLVKHADELERIFYKCMNYYNNAGISEGKKQVLNTLFNRTIGVRYICFLHLPISRVNKNRLRKFDNYVTVNYPSYKPQGSIIPLLRKTNCRLYLLLALYIRITKTV